ncbi:Uncharacterised protein [Mycobacterium tuberculosis]|nr:Uncharacterised protein [Mycobacterium tuberculosis]
MRAMMIIGDWNVAKLAISDPMTPELKASNGFSLPGRITSLGK